jgi:DNA polymerase III subunit alpha
MVYQEQVMQIAQVMAATRWAAPTCCAARWARRSPRRWPSSASIFVEGARRNAVIRARRQAELFDLMEKFAGYGFNKSHAAAYALVSYQTAYLQGAPCGRLCRGQPCRW